MIRAVVFSLLLAAIPAGAEPTRPAELPPSDYAGQQYVDSKGCMFVRAGRPGKVVWIPRVTREGKPLCDNPPSGHRVPVVEEIGVLPVPSTGTSGVEVAGEAADADGVGSYFVAVGSFGVSANAEKAEARLAALKYDVVRGRVQGKSGALITVFAGPFPDVAAASTARDALRGDGFPDAILIRP